jgi:hypothetical protein
MASDELKLLYPALPDEAFPKAAENLDRYFLLAWEITENQSTPAELETGADQAYHPDQGRFCKHSAYSRREAIL